MSSRKTILLLLIISTLIYCNEAQDGSCIMPDGYTKSICVMLHLCDHFYSQLKIYGFRNAPQTLRNDLIAHACPQRKYVCCPDNVIKSTTTPEPEIELAIEELNLNLDQIRDHPNYNLINKNGCGTTITQRIIGGVSASLIEFPWAVLLGYRGDAPNKIVWDCGGNLINERYVLTAAHCIKKKLLIVRLGEHTISTAPDCDYHGACITTQDIAIEENIIHPQYNKYNGKNDIALVKLNKPANTMVPNVKTICLPTLQKADIERVKSKNFTISGWGNSDNGTKSDTLLKSQVKLQDANQCTNSLAKASYKVSVYPENICAGGYDKLHACKGDSGGGLTTTVTIDRKQRTYLYGLLARGVKCDSVGVFPDVYVNIKKYLGWILDSMS